MTTPEVTKGSNTTPGQGEQLPQGAATDINDANAVAAQAIEQGAPAGPMQSMIPEDVQFDHQPQGKTFTPQDEDEEILFSDATGRGLPGGPQQSDRLPADVVRYLPMMAEMAADPKAPASLKALYRALVNRLEQEMRA